MKLAAMLAAALALCGATGCAGTAPLRVYEDPAAAPKSVAMDATSGGTAAGVLCLFAFAGDGYPELARALVDAGYRFLASGEDAAGCDALVSVRRTGASAYGTSYVDVYAAYGGEKLEQIQAEGGWGPVFGYERAGRYLQSELLSDSPLRKKLAMARAARPLLSPDKIAALAGAAAINWDRLYSWNTSDANRLWVNDLRAAAAARATAAHKDEPVEKAASSSAEKPWWSKGQ